MVKPMTRERATAVVSAVAAIAILGLGATAQPARRAAGDRLAQLESDLRYQLELGSRLDRTALDAGAKALESTLAAWRKSPQSPGDYVRMTAWLRTALVRSLPGESGAWPATPAFSAAVEVRVARKEIAAEEIVKKVAKPRSVATRQAPARVKQAVVAARPAPSAAQVAAAYGGVKVEPVAAKPRAAKVEVTAVSAAVAVEVNLAELNARIGGYHEGLREIEASLVARRAGMTVGQVAQLAGQLELLAGQYQFVRLYYDSLNRDERQFVTAPRAMTSTIERVDRERARVEAAADEDFFAANDPEGASELANRLKELAEIAGK